MLVARVWDTHGNPAYHWRILSVAMVGPTSRPGTAAAAVRGRRSGAGPSLADGGGRGTAADGDTATPATFLWIFAVFLESRATSLAGARWGLSPGLYR